MEERTLAAPAEAVEAERERWRGSGTDVAARLRGVGLTPAELEDALAARANVEWLLALEPESLGLDFEPRRRWGGALSERLSVSGPGAPDRRELLREAAESAFATAWARIAHGPPRDAPAASARIPP